MSATAAAAGSAPWAETCFTAYKHIFVRTASRLQYLRFAHLKVWISLGETKSPFETDDSL